VIHINIASDKFRHKRNKVRSILVAMFVVVTLFLGNAFAATPVAEPKLQADIEQYLAKEISCTKYAGKVLVKKTYGPVIGGVVRKITVLTLNSEKVAQIDKAPQGTAYYVKSSSLGYWLAYTKSEVGEAIARLLSEIGLTQRQFLSCGK